MRIAAVLFFAAYIGGAQAHMTYYLVKEWYESGSHMCKYGNGTVLNVGYKICPLSIDG
jgi:hypothetical protein